ncbi:MAG: SDR family oxidoreductase [Gammaproteobacteria bacterium]|nr:SDR family oxidoreductase [Gammaproteobacteria bacterium]
MQEKSFFSLESEVAVITGGASGIGLETVRRLADAGAKLVIADLQDASSLAEEVGGIFLKTDVSDEQEVLSLLQTAREHFGKLDILVSNAGVFADYKLLSESKAEDFDFCYSVNTKSVAWGLKYAGQFINEGGRIINTASSAATQGVISLASYVASKYAVIGLTKTAALELAEKNIRVNCICPGTVDTPMANEGEGDYLLDAEKTLVPLGRICRAEEAAALIHFLAAKDCDFINGQAIMLDGGLSAGISEKTFEKLSAS